MNIDNDPLKGKIQSEYLYKNAKKIMEDRFPQTELIQTDQEMKVNSTDCHNLQKEAFQKIAPKTDFTELPKNEILYSNNQ